MSCGKRWKWHFRDPKFKNFLGEKIYTSASPHLGTQTCLNYVYTNVPQKITKAEMCLTNITDAVLYTVANRLPLCQETKHFQRFFSFLYGFILSDLEATVSTVFLTSRQTCDRSDRSDHMEIRL